MLQRDMSLPSIRKLKKLAEWDGPFPMKSYRIVIGADRFGFDEDTMEFLKRFPHNTIFASRDDFLQRCQDLREAIRAKRTQAPL